MDHNLLISILDFKGLSIQSLFLKILTLLGLPRGSLFPLPTWLLHIFQRQLPCKEPLRNVKEEF